MIAALGLMSGIASAQPLGVADRLPSQDDWKLETGTVGVMTDLGVPDGASASLVMRPIRAIRLEAGVASNLVSPGVRGGFSYLPLHGWFTPSLSLAYGHFFERDANGVAQTISGDHGFTSPMLEKVGYDFANARVGLEFGKKYFTFFLHAGVSRVTGDVHNLNQVADGQTMDSNVSITSTDPKVTIWSVSANLGFIFYVH
ncbi:MAG: hypothetical protein QM831_37850 [Kofleriaceae bacterium]